MPQGCAVERTAAGGSGRCAMPETARVALAAPHMWEEPCISGDKGSGAIFFEGCPLGCVFCQNRSISALRGDDPPAGSEYSPKELAGLFEKLELIGVHNINLVTGTHFIPSIIKAMRIFRPHIPVVWNSSGYETAAAVDALAPYIDIWLPDYKYGLAETAAKYSDAPDYPETALEAIKRMRRHCPENVMENGLLRRGVIVRHLVLPGNTRSSVSALKSIAEALPELR